MMYVAELTYPGTWLVHTDEDKGQEMRSVLYLVEGQLTEAAVALNLFEQAQNTLLGTPGVRRNYEQRQEDSAREQELINGYGRILYGDEQPSPWSDDYDELRHLAGVGVKREKWNAGVWPRSYKHSLPFVYAKSFLHSMDAIKKLVGTLAQMDGVPANVAKHTDAFDACFPHLKGVRDSVQHIEDRGRGLKRGKRWTKEPLNLKPIDNRMVHAPDGGVLILNSLNDNKYGTTMEDGSYGEVEVSRHSLLKAQECVQGIVDSFQWKGPKQHYPYS